MPIKKAPDLTCLVHPAVSCHDHVVNENTQGGSCSPMMGSKVVQWRCWVGVDGVPEVHKSIPTLDWKSSRIRGGLG